MPYPGDVHYPGILYDRSAEIKRVEKNNKIIY